MTSYLADMFTRIDNAHAAFIETLMRCGECTRDEAIKVKDFYLKNKLAKLHTQTGEITVQHGAYLETDVIQSAINY